MITIDYHVVKCMSAGRLTSINCYFCALHCSAIWATKQTEPTEDNKELRIKTTLRELIVYCVFLAILCVSKYKEVDVTLVCLIRMKVTIMNAVVLSNSRIMTIFSLAYFNFFVRSSLI